jgi:hypothetical protein
MVRIHSDEMALRAVLAEIRRTGADQIVCLGDVATFEPRPKPVIEMKSAMLSSRNRVVFGAVPWLAID